MQLVFGRINANEIPDTLRFIILPFLKEIVGFLVLKPKRYSKTVLLQFNDIHISQVRGLFRR